MRMKGVEVGSMLFFIAAFVALLVAAFMMAGSENSKATQSEKKASEALAQLKQLVSQIESLDKKIDAGDDAVKRLAEIMISKDNEHEKMRQKLEWLEMKSSNQPKASNHMNSRVTLTQEKPLQINVLYREAAPKKKLNEGQIKAKIINRVKEQLQGLEK